MTTQPDTASELAREIFRFWNAIHSEDELAALLRPHLGERWIPVSEKLPDRGQIVLLWHGGVFDTGWLTYRDEGDVDDIWQLERTEAHGDAILFAVTDDLVTHWKVPAPPAEGGRS